MQGRGLIPWPVTGALPAQNLAQWQTKHSKYSEISYIQLSNNTVYFSPRESPIMYFLTAVLGRMCEEGEMSTAGLQSKHGHREAI